MLNAIMVPVSIALGALVGGALSVKVCQWRETRAPRTVERTTRVTVPATWDGFIA